MAFRSWKIIIIWESVPQRTHKINSGIYGSEARAGLLVDLFCVKASITCTFNNLQGVGDCQRTPKRAQAENLAGDCTGEKLTASRADYLTGVLPEFYPHHPGFLRLM